MDAAKSEFTNVTNLRSEALGDPGQRTFRILVDSGTSSAIIWIEKEQLFQLALSIHQILASAPDEATESNSPPSEMEAPDRTHLDIKSGQMLLGHDGTGGLFTIDAFHEDDDEEDAATIRLWANRKQVEAFAEESLRVCAAGRSLCPLCGRPIDPSGHLCPRSNGHADLSRL